jgi:Tol biopolymer transport system component
MPSPFAKKFRSLLPGQQSELTVINADGTGRDVIFAVDDAIIEAPNWHPDGDYLVFNAGGEIWRINVDGSGLKKIETGTIRDLNNDHVLSPDGKTIYLSNQSDGALYSVGIEGGTPRKISNDHKEPHHYYLHGVSPDDKTLSYVAVEGPQGKKRVNIFTIPTAGGPDTRLSDVSYPNDGPEYSPDGKWMYFSSERDATEPGHAQCYRMRPDGTGIERLSHSERVDWFPHISPDNTHCVYISYPKGTLGHPENKNVRLMLMPADGSWHKEIIAFFGGQGTINVNSWAPDSKRFAYVAYPVMN